MRVFIEVYKSWPESHAELAARCGDSERRGSPGRVWESSWTRLEAAIDTDLRARDVAGGIGGEEQHRLRDLIHCSHALQRDHGLVDFQLLEVITHVLLS